MNTERKRAFIINTIYLLIIIAASILFIKYALPKVAIFLVAFIIAYLLHKPTCYVSQKLHLPYKLVSILMVLLFYCIIGFLIVLLIAKTFGSVTSLIAFLPDFYNNKIMPAFSDLFISFENLLLQLDSSLVSMIQGYDNQFMQWLGTYISVLSSSAISVLSSIATSIPALFVKLVLMIISTFFITLDYDKLTGFCLRQLNTKSMVLFLQIKNYLVGTLLVCIGSYSIIITMTFLELSIGLSLIGVDNAILIALIIAIFDILPVLGTGGIMIPWAILSFLRGNIARGIALLILYVIITVIRNIVEPKIVGSQLGLHPIITLSSMYVGVQLFGIVGLFGFPILLSLLRYLNDKGSIHIYKTEKK